MLAIKQKEQIYIYNFMHTMIYIDTYSTYCLYLKKTNHQHRKVHFKINQGVLRVAPSCLLRLITLMMMDIDLWSRERAQQLLFCSTLLRTVDDTLET